jgi:putative membrane protein
MRTKNSSRSFSDYLILASKGFCMGCADVIPGVSGGTMAFILGIYEELIDAIKSFDLKSLKLLTALKVRSFLNSVSWQILLAVATGILTAIFALAGVLSWLLQNRPVLIWSFFFGLILASVISVSRRVGAWRIATWMCLLGGIIGTYFFVGLVPVSTPDDLWFLFLCGSCAICATMLPGISGAFVLVLLGKYKYVLDAVNHRDFVVLLVVVAGAGLGMVFFSRILAWLLKNYHDLMVAILTGLMLGSLRKVWPWKETLASFMDRHGNIVPTVQANIVPAHWNGEVTAALGLMVAGLVAVLLLDRLGEKK